MKKFFSICFILSSCLLFSQVRDPNPKLITTDIWHDVRAYKGRSETYVEAFNDAIAAASAGDIIFCNQSFTATDTIEVNKAVTLLIGACTIATTCDPLVYITADDPKITSLVLDYGAKLTATTHDTINVIRIGPSVKNVTIENIWVDGAGKTINTDDRGKGNCIYAAGTIASRDTNIVIQNCKFTDGHNAVLLAHSDHCKVTHNYFDFTHDAWVGVCNYGGNNNNISFNDFLDNAGTSNAVELLDRAAEGVAGAVKHCNVFGNEISGFDKEGILVTGFKNNISTNQIYTEDKGIALLQYSGAIAMRTYENNVINNTITITEISDAQSACINIHDSATDTVSIGSWRNKISLNRCYMLGKGYGIWVDGGSDYSEITDNYIEFGTDSTGIHGIWISDTTANAKIIGNEIRNADVYGIYVSVEPDSCYIAMNRVYGCAVGIGVSTGEGHTVILNEVKNNTTTGISIIGDPTNLLYFGNIVIGNGTDESFSGSTTFRPMDIHSGVSTTKAAVDDSLRLGSGDWIWKIEVASGLDSLDIITAFDTLRIGFMEYDK